MIKDKTYRFDDEFKSLARAHQFHFRENELRITYDEKNPQVMLTPEAAKEGLIFYEDYSALIFDKIGKFNNASLFSNMLRSEHIPYNVFAPMELDLDNATRLFNRITGNQIARITGIKIEFAGIESKDKYLDDGTSFDTFIEYRAMDGNRGGIGIEVKYTENGYPLGKKEKNDIEDPERPYARITNKSGYYFKDLDIKQFTHAHHLRQIWRNHILGYAMIDNGDICHFHHIHLYPFGNTHFREYALPEYKKLLTARGTESFIDLTYEELFNWMKECFSQSDKQKRWIEYLCRRYLFNY